MYKKKYIAYLLILPMLAFLVIFLFYPFIVNIKVSFYHYLHPFDVTPNFVGFGNFKTLFADRYFKISLINTLKLMGLVLVFQVGLALILALLVDKVPKFNTFFRVTYFVPIIISATALGLMFQMIFKFDGGLLNQILGYFKIKPIRWLDMENGRRTFYTMMSPVVWQYIGFYFVIFLTGLSTVSTEMIEAAKIDGASEWQIITRIKLPLLQNITRIVIVLAITGTLKVFDLPYILNSTSFPNGSPYILGTYMYDLFRGFTKMGVAAAFSIILAVLGVGLSSLVNVIFKPNEDI